MSVQEIEEYVPLDWLNQHYEEYISMAERIMKIIMMAEARKKGWKSPLKDDRDFERFIEAEARDRNLTQEEVRNFIMDAGKIKARNTIFDTYFSEKLPKNQNGDCIISRKDILKFIKYSVEDRKRPPT